MNTVIAAIVLSGCGVYDGSEIQEAVIAALDLQKLGVKTEFFAPDVEQADTVNHLTGKAEDKSRSVLSESARIARGKISPLSQYDADKFDLLVFPGGFGAAKNLCSFAFDGAACKVDADVERAVKSTIARGKPVAFMCIAPVVGAKIVGSGARLTIGNDAATAKALEAMGAKHVACSADSFVRDDKFKIWSTPAFMLASNAAEVESGTYKMFADIVSYIKKR